MSPNFLLDKGRVAENLQEECFCYFIISSTSLWRNHFNHIHFQGVFRQTPKFKEFSRLWEPCIHRVLSTNQIYYRSAKGDVINLIGRWHEWNNYRQYIMACCFYFFSNYEQTSEIIWWKKIVHGNGWMLFCRSQVVVFILDISTPLVSVDLIGNKNQVIIEYLTSSVCGDKIKDTACISFALFGIRSFKPTIF